MNPALPLLALLAAAGALALRCRQERWRELGIAWMLSGFVGLALLAPALQIPDGIPSPAATLAQHPPWQQVGDPAAGNPLLRDVTYQIQPWLLHLRSELRAGRLPLWNPHQSSGTPFWANGQSAPLFPLHLLFAALPLQLGFVLLPWLRLTVAGCGVWVLARELGLGRPAAAVATVIYPLSGMLVSFQLFPMGNALALVPWVLWAIERIAAGRGGWGGLALLGGLQLLGGHPETCAHTALLGALYLAVRGGAERWRAWRHFVLGWLGAAAVAAVQILPLALLLPATTKWQQAHDGVYPPLAVLGHQLLRLVLPQLFGHPAAGTWWGPFNYSATAVYAGALALPLAAAGLAAARADRRWRGVAALLVFSLLAAYHLPGLRELLAALPVFGRSALHRLIFGVELGLALLAGAGCERWLAGKGRGLLAGAGAVVALLAIAWSVDGGAWAARGLVREQVLWTVWGLAVCLALALSLRLSRVRRWSAWPLLLVAGSADLLAAHLAINPGLSLARLYPRTGAVAFLQGQTGRVAGVGEALRPNAALVYGLDDVRGDDPVKLASYDHEVYAGFAAPDPVYYQPITRWEDPGLDRLGVRWVVAGPAEPPPVPGWRLAYGGSDARVYERPVALAPVRWAEPGEAGRDERVLRRQGGHWEIAWRSSSPGRLVVADTWAAGWRAANNGRPLAIEPADGLVAVRLPAGEGTLELRYRPPGIVPGALLSLCGIGLAGWSLRRRTVAGGRP
jgi:hypothetical protein